MKIVWSLLLVYACETFELSLCECVKIFAERSGAHIHNCIDSVMHRFKRKTTMCINLFDYANIISTLVSLWLGELNFKLIATEMFYQFL